MSSRTSAALDYASATETFAESDKPTRPLPALSLAVLAAEARRINEERSLDEQDQTVTIGPEENKKLLASVHALGQAGRPAFGRDADAGFNSDEAPTLDELLTLPQTLEPAPVPVTEHDALIPSWFPRASASLVIPAAPEAPIPELKLAAPPASGTRPRVTAQVAKVSHEEDLRRRRDSQFTFHLPKPNSQTLVVAGIWVLALSLFAVLMMMARSA